MINFVQKIPKMDNFMFFIILQSKERKEEIKKREIKGIKCQEMKMKIIK